MSEFSEADLTEYAMNKTIYEAFNKTYRKNHRELDKSVNNIQKSFGDFREAKDINSAIKMVDTALKEVLSLKRKAASIFSEEQHFVISCKRRLEHISQISCLDDKSTPGQLSAILDSVRHWPSLTSTQHNAPHFAYLLRFQRHLADHLFVIGRPHAALQLAHTRDELAKLCPTNVYEEAVRVEDALRLGQTGPAHAWLQEANFKLKKTETNYEFDLRIFEFYLLVRDEQRLSAVAHARQYLNQVGDSNSYRAKKLGQAMLLLAIPRSDSLTELAIKSELTEEWIVKRTHDVFIEFYSFSMYTPFELAVNAGISAIKTHQCYEEHTRDRDCPVCHPLINLLGSCLPFGRHDHSILTCFRTGLEINDDNPPMSLPNGYVYSQKGIRDLTDKDSIITCPRSGQQFHVGQAERIYIV